MRSRFIAKSRTHSEPTSELQRSYNEPTTEEERKANEAKNLLPPKQQPVHNFIVYLRTNELQ